VKQIQDSVQVSAEARESSDAREGLAAFLEKRKPKWQTS
jgi:enoyl-CoA hydratase/carnithine racemase